MSLLSEEKIDEIAKDYKAILLEGNPYFPWFDYAKAIEAEVLEAQKKQEPVGFVDPLAIELAKSKPNNDCLGFRMKPEPGDIPLYAAPVVQPGMVLVPREPTMAMREAIESSAVVTFSRTKAIYAALIAAAGGSHEP